METKTLLGFWKVIILFALLIPIISASSEIYTSRRYRSSYIDTSPLVSESSDTSDHNPSDNRSRKPIETSQEYQHSSAKQEKATVSNLKPNNTYDIFYLGPEKGVVLFNKSSPISPINRMQADSPFTNKEVRQEQSFKVQRAPDGKLNVVFNDYRLFQKTSVSHNIPTEKNDAIIFPDQQNPHRISEPKCDERINEGKSFCTKVRNYPPPSQLASILKNELPKFEVFFGEDLAQPTNVTQRMNNEPDEEYLCKSKEYVIYPEAGETRDSGWLLIVNNHENLTQGVRIEECTHEGARCDTITDSLPNRYTATCKQSYIYRSLVAITNNNEVTKGYFKMPSCCKCVLKHTRN